MIGTTLSHYTILKQLASGGMGDVYLAEDTHLPRKVALKILPSRFANQPDRLRRFLNEARAVSALNHPNILVVHDTGQCGKLHFIATEYVEGRTLRGHLASRRLPLNEAIEIAVQIADALASAHETGIVHRDIKPENIMIRTDGYVKILDFGLAKLNARARPIDATKASTITQIGQIIGTARYMSPEQVRGTRVDARSDIFSFGVLLYEMITGTVPFYAKNIADLITEILENDPMSIMEYSPDAPEQLECIIKKMMRKQTEERYQTARELLNDLKALRRTLELSAELKSPSTS